MRHKSPIRGATGLLVSFLALSSEVNALAETKPASESAPAAASTGAADSNSFQESIRTLRSLLDAQQAQIRQMTEALAEQEERVRAMEAAVARTPAPGIPALVTSAGVPPAAAFAAVPTAPPEPAQDAAQFAARLDDFNKRLDGALANINGFKLSGDFRFRLDGQLRSGNAIAGPLQNVRSRYRLRLNVDKELDPKFKVHAQLSTAPVNNSITNDQDMAGMAAKHPFFIAEASLEYRPTPNIALRGGRMEEAFADNMRFLWDDDVRFNGFQQTVTIPIASSGALKSIEIKAGEYFLSNPNVAVLGNTSPFVAAGYLPGQKVRAANLFHPGFILRGDLDSNWSHQLGGDVQIYRNANQIQLASTADGVPLLINNAIGLTPSGPATGTGNATLAAGAPAYHARHFQIVRGTYRVQHKGVRVAGRDMPLYFDVQAARNAGTTYQRDAVMGSINFGQVRGPKDVRFLYQFGLKQANSMISQFTDDDLGTGTGVNIRVHAIRADLGITRFLQWQNLLFLQNQISQINASRSFFVPLQSGANRTYRYLGQLAFTF